MLDGKNKENIPGNRDHLLPRQLPRVTRRYLHQRRSHPERSEPTKRNLDRKNHRAGFSGVDVFRG